MDVILAAVVSVAIGFIAGVIFAKQVVSEAEQLKEHITEEVSATEGRLRADIADVRSKIASKL